ncbi:hypothetical protein [Hyphomicrobium sp.]|uniref:hypothetical protein n=1 Tax=Hyphomicrobium sp. TaxID=82 RepID=UPI000F92401A|nr:hypothetical protein [Hyphomicrobium sp.]RUP07551.1 MAG: hypothetical protein EKK38_18390 [Hyphomicrobium sp.]
MSYTSSSTYLIDPPSPFAPKKDWEEHLAALCAQYIADAHPDLKEAIEEAEAHLAGLAKSAE